jgi:UDP-N-acetylglucosamine:LPS N-acetylglucosamine transferase
MLVASAGGHWIQLSRLKPAFEGHQAQYVTTLRGVRPPSGSRPVAYVKDASRSNVFGLIVLVLQMFFLIIRFRPHVVITTGAAPGLIALQIARMIRIRTVWIDSIANSEKLSLSGRMAERCADLWLTQWPHLAAGHPNLKHIGSVL